MLHGAAEVLLVGRVWLRMLVGKEELLLVGKAFGTASDVSQQNYAFADVVRHGLVATVDVPADGADVTAACVGKIHQAKQIDLYHLPLLDFRNDYFNGKYVSS